MCIDALIANLWNPKTASYKDSIVDGKYKIKGTILYCGNEYRFRMNEQPEDSRFSLRGNVTMISPDNGDRAQLHGKKRREKMDQSSTKYNESDVNSKSDSETKSEKIPERFIIQKAINLHTKEPSAVKAAIAKAILELHREYGEDNNPALRKIPPHKLFSAQLLHLHKQGYINSKGDISNRQTQRTNKHLNDVFRLLPPYRAIGDITLADVEKIVPHLSSDPMGAIREAKNFIEYCVGRTAQHIDNPFDRFLQAYKCQKSKLDPDKIVKKP